MNTRADAAAWFVSGCKCHLYGMYTMYGMCKGYGMRTAE